MERTAHGSFGCGGFLPPCQGDGRNTAAIQSWATAQPAHGLNLMDLFFGDRADDFKRSQVEDAVAFIPYGCMVDEFQHIVYDHPEMTPQERKEAWKELEKGLQTASDFGEEYPFFEQEATAETESYLCRSLLLYRLLYCPDQCIPVPDLDGKRL